MFCLNIHQTSHFFVVCCSRCYQKCSLLWFRLAWKVKHESCGRRALVRYGHLTSVRPEGHTDLLVQPVILLCLAPLIVGENFLL